MSDTDIIERDATTGRFLAGNGGGGRKVGSRNLLTTQFLDDLRTTWTEHGAVALARCAVEEPAQFCRIVASLMPRDLNINMTAEVDAVTFAERFRNALALLHAEPARTIEHDNAANKR